MMRPSSLVRTLFFGTIGPPASKIKKCNPFSCKQLGSYRARKIVKIMEILFDSYYFNS